MTHVLQVLMKLTMGSMHYLMSTVHHLCTSTPYSCCFNIKFLTRNGQNQHTTITCIRINVAIMKIHRCVCVLTSTHIINTFSSCHLLIHFWDSRDKISTQDRVMCQSVNECLYSSVLCSETLRRSRRNRSRRKKSRVEEERRRRMEEEDGGGGWRRRMEEEEEEAKGKLKTHTQSSQKKSHLLCLKFTCCF